MALAIIDFEGADRKRAWFRIDIGKNAYYSYAIGGRDTTRRNGLEMLVDPVFTSPILGPLSTAAMGRASLQVPRERFDPEHRRIQMASFRKDDRTGPAISEIVAVPLADGVFDDVPAPAFFSGAQALIFASSSGANMTTTRGIVENVPYSYQRGEVYSSAMFLEAITAILPLVLPALGPLLGDLAKSGDSANGKGSAPPSLPANLLATLGGPETARLLAELVRQIAGAKPVGTSLTYSDHEGQRAAVHALSQYHREFSEAKVAPALLAALPALMPIIEKILNPETMKAIMENVSPAKLLGTVADAIGNFGKLGMENTKQLQAHLERLNPGVTSPELYKLLESLSTGEARAGSKLKYRRVDSVKLRFGETTTQPLYGRARLAYRYGQDLSFPLDVDTPRPIRQGTLEVCLKEAGTLKIVHEKTQPVSDVSGGRLQTVPSIPWSALSRQRPGEDYLLTCTLCWNGKAGRPQRGTAVSQLVTLVSEYAFDRVEESSPDLVPLNDVVRDREFWHRLWEQTFDGRGLTRLRFSCDYCYVLEGQRASNAWMHTHSRLEAHESQRQAGKLRGGMILSPDSLSKLIPRVSGGVDQPLSDAQLDALRTPDFVDRFNQKAKTQVDFKARRGESAALWVYPEMKLCNVVLKRIDDVDEHGHVRSFKEETVRFPMPAMVHFVGASSAP